MKAKILLTAFSTLLIVHAQSKKIYEEENDSISTTMESDTSLQGTVTDIDGNTYPWIKIGEQCWMVQNIRTTRYADGTSIPYLENSADWDTLTEYGKAYCYYDTAGTGYKHYTKENFGALYSWAAASNWQGEDSTTINIQGVCPDGWHLPSDEEWTQMEHYLARNGFAYDTTEYDGSETDKEARKKIAKSLATNWGWHNQDGLGNVGNSDNPEKQNLSGFSAVPTGYRHYNGIFGHIGAIGIWWSSTEYCFSLATLRYIGSKYPSTHRFSYDTDYGISVRCVRD